MGIIKGKKLMCWVKGATGDYKSIGFATNHTISTSASTISISHKDLADAGSGHWQDQDIDELSWTITAEAFYANEAEGYTFEDIWAFFAAGTVLDLKFATAADSSTGVPTGGWAVPQTGFILSGKAIISSVDVNAPTAENASFSITFTGKGALSAN